MTTDKGTEALSDLKQLRIDTKALIQLIELEKELQRTDLNISLADVIELLQLIHNCGGITIQPTLDGQTLIQSVGLSQLCLTFKRKYQWSSALTPNKE